MAFKGSPGRAQERDRVVLVQVEVPLEIDRGAIADLAVRANLRIERVRDRLRALDTYVLDTDVSTKAAVGEGRYREFRGQVRYVVDRPRPLFADIRGDAIARQVYFDGQRVSVYAPDRQAYAQWDAPGTIEALLATARDQRGLDLPVAHLFAWNEEPERMRRSTRATYSGTRLIKGRECEHYSYKYEDVVWELHVDRDALPCKISMIDLKDRGLPGYSAEFTWTTGTPVSPEAFRFTPPPGMQQVPLSQMPES